MLTRSSSWGRVALIVLTLAFAVGAFLAISNGNVSGAAWMTGVALLFAWVLIAYRRSRVEEMVGESDPHID